MTEVGEVNAIPSLTERFARSQRDHEIVALAESIFVHQVTRTGSPHAAPAHALEDAAASLRAARAFYEAVDEWTATRAAAAAAEGFGEACDARR